jgi:hypothetical protein
MRRTTICLMTLGLVNPGVAQHCPLASPIFQVGEELQYAVRWKFIRLGTITVNTVNEVDSGGSPKVQITMRVESSPGIPVVTLREDNEATMDIVQMRSLSFSASHELNGNRQSLRHTFDPGEKSVTTEFIEADGGDPITKVLQGVDWYVEGVTLFFYAREAARRGGKHHIPTLVNQVIARTTLSVDDRPEDLTLDAVDYPVRSRRLSGTAEWTGSAAGVTGDFVGWVSDDEASVMLRAELEIFLGSIDIELEQWTRAGWTPPMLVTAAK